MNRFIKGEDSVNGEYQGSGGLARGTSSRCGIYRDSLPLGWSEKNSFGISVERSTSQTFVTVRSARSR